MICYVYFPTCLLFWNSHCRRPKKSCWTLFQKYTTKGFTGSLSALGIQKSSPKKYLQMFTSNYNYCKEIWQKYELNMWDFNFLFSIWDFLQQGISQGSFRCRCRSRVRWRKRSSTGSCRATAGFRTHPLVPCRRQPLQSGSPEHSRYWPCGPRDGWPRCPADRFLWRPSWCSSVWGWPGPCSSWWNVCFGRYLSPWLYFCANLFCPKDKCSPLFSNSLPCLNKCQETSQKLTRTEQTFGVIFQASFGEKMALLALRGRQHLS